MRMIKTHPLFSVSIFPQRVTEFARRTIRSRSLTLKTKITFFIVFNVVGVLLLSSYLDYHLSKRDQIDVYLNRNVYMAKQIDISIPDPTNADNISRIRDELEEWLMSRPRMVGIDLFLFSTGGWESAVSISSGNESLPLILSKDQIDRLKKDKLLSSVQGTGEEERLDVIVPLHSGKKVIGGIRVASSLDEVQAYLNKKKARVFILTFSSILVILITLTLSFRHLVGNPLQKIVETMSLAEKGDLEAEARVRSRDELGELAKNLNRMLKTIREAHDENVQLLARVSQFNEELTRKVESATSELAKRNEELRLLNEALFESQRQLSQSEKLAALGQVTAAMAHQIGTPLNSISGYIQLILQDGNLHSTDQNRLKIIESQVDRLADSVKNLLTFTRQPKPHLRPLDVNGVLEELIHLSQPWLHTRKVRLHTSLSQDLPSILGDPTQLQTALLNLISNALDAMPQGGMLTIGTRRIPEPSDAKDGKWVQISIVDTGIGITEETKKRIFDPFFTTKKAGEGTGLGLSICEKIVREHFGKLDVESQVGKGSMFTIRLPIMEGTTFDEQSDSPSPGRR
jgi:two-component system, NtrC family, sensor kinase